MGDGGWGMGVGGEPYKVGIQYNTTVLLEYRVHSSDSTQLHTDLSSLQVSTRVR